MNEHSSHPVNSERKPLYVLLLETLVGSCLFGMMLLITIEVISRYVFGTVQPWGEEAARIMFIYLTFLGAGLAVLRGENLKVDFIVSLFPAAVKKTISVITDIMACFFLIIVIAFSFPLLKKVYFFPMPAMQFSTSYLYVAVPIGCFFMLMFTIMKYIRKR